jgi:hypothetical protein
MVITLDFALERPVLENMLLKSCHVWRGLGPTLKISDKTRVFADAFACQDRTFSGKKPGRPDRHRLEDWAE